MGEQRIRNRLALPAQNVKRPAEIHQLAVFRALLPVHVQQMSRNCNMAAAGKRRIGSLTLARLIPYQRPRAGPLPACSPGS
jgi:hypothetical protein